MTEFDVLEARTRARVLLVEGPTSAGTCLDWHLHARDGDCGRDQAFLGQTPRAGVSNVECSRGAHFPSSGTTTTSFPNPGRLQRPSTTPFEPSRLLPHKDVQHLPQQSSRLPSGTIPPAELSSDPRRARLSRIRLHLGDQVVEHINSTMSC